MLTRISVIKDEEPELLNHEDINQLLQQILATQQKNKEYLKGEKTDFTGTIEKITMNGLSKVKELNDLDKEVLKKVYERTEYDNQYLINKCLKNCYEIENDLKNRESTKKLYKEEFTKIKDLNIDLIDREVKIKGLLKRNTQITPFVKKREYECTSCGKIHTKKPRRGVCEHCEGFIEENVERTNLIKTVFEEQENNLEKNQQKPVIEAWFVKETRKVYELLSYGDLYEVTGVLSVKRKKKGHEWMEYFKIDAYDIKKIDNDLTKIKINPLEEQKIKELSKKENRNEILTKTIFGEDLVDLSIPMEACLLQMSGSPKLFQDGVLKNRGNIMILLAGSPGKGKTALLRRVVSFFPKSVFATCTSASSVGLITSVEKDDRLGGWTISPGAIPLCNPGGVCAVDEIDKMPKGDQSKINSMMDSLKIEVHKATIHQFLEADVSLLCSMNPKYRYFDNTVSESYTEQLNLPKDFLDRFDLIFNLDFFNKKKNDLLALDLALDSYDEDNNVKKEETYDRDLVKKYFGMVRKTNPKMTNASKEFIKQKFKELLGEREGDTSYYSKRFLGVLIRLSMAYARLRLGETVELIDVQDAKYLLLKSFESMGMLKKLPTGQLVIDENRVEGIIPEKDVKGRDLLLKKAKEIGADKGLVNVEFLKEVCDTERFDEFYEKMKRAGDFYEPKPGKTKLVL